MEIKFPQQKGTGFHKLIPHVSDEGKNVIEKMLIYNKDERWTCSQVLKHPYFKEFRELDQ